MPDDWPAPTPTPDDWPAPTPTPDEWPAPTPTPDEWPAPTNEWPSSPDDWPAPSDEWPAPPDDWPASSDDWPAPPDDWPASSDDWPAPSDEWPAPSDEWPASSDDWPASWSAAACYPGVPRGSRGHRGTKNPAVWPKIADSRHSGPTMAHPITLAGHAMPIHWPTMAKKSSRIPMPPIGPPHFDDLVANATGFVRRAIDELFDTQKPDRLKFSAIFFYQAIELFVKARLLHEHWTLVLGDPKRADLARFENGDFISVGLGEAVGRLKRVCKEDISLAAEVFEPVRLSRNRAIHFHAKELHWQPLEQIDPAMAQGSDPYDGTPPEVMELLRQQLRAWYELHRLLTIVWQERFNTTQLLNIRWLDSRMRDLRPYLATLYSHLQSTINEARISGKRVTECPACGYPASVGSPLVSFPSLIENDCLVCKRAFAEFRFPCPEEDCDGEIVVSGDGGGGQCAVCGHVMTIQDLATRYHPTYRKQEDYLLCRDVASCSDCDGLETVVRIQGLDKFICFSCLAVYDFIHECERCGELVTGDTTDSYWKGCMMCYDSWASNMKDD